MLCFTLLTLCCMSYCVVLQASGPATIYFTGIIMGNEKLGFSQTLKVAVVCTGVAIASYGEQLGLIHLPALDAGRTYNISCSWRTQ